jgi:hypothetical protein
VKESKRVEKMGEASGVDLARCNFVALSFSCIPSLIIADSAAFGGTRGLPT